MICHISELNIYILDYANIIFEQIYNILSIKHEHYINANKLIYINTIKDYIKDNK